MNVEDISGGEKKKEKLILETYNFCTVFSL